MPQQSPMCSPAGERRRVSENQRKLYLDYIKILEQHRKILRQQDVGMMHKNIGAIKFWNNAGKC